MSDTIITDAITPKDILVAVVKQLDHMSQTEYADFIQHLKTKYDARLEAHYLQYPRHRP
ncbi:hypothetical protein I2I05_08645 [Hymenobacter sp. BT683]|uniref:DUF2281 domain-containing protein n=1 Tax=Hymenobacter jeongseonensis TaxID=2791027 RepID=A0ABS0IGH4_9BACT|nr:hypothetical protein [Hymenobacter jeongseonensis]MBF9237465.1 hypothetical protein [Hymenobacter jeongseonensis]